MEIRIKKEAFLKGLQLAQSIADRKSKTPILANVLLRTDGQDAVVCAATDLRVAVVAEAKAEVDQEGDLTVGAKPLYEIVKNLPDGDVHFKKTDSGWCDITGGQAHYRVVCLPAQDFPRLPVSTAVRFKELDAQIVLDMIRKTIFSASSDQSREHINGIFLEWQNKIVRMVSTDGHRLSKVEYDVGEGDDASNGIIIPRKGVLEMRRLLETVEGTCDLGFHEDSLFVRANDACLSIKLVDAQFPPYDQVLPKTSERQVVVDRLVLLDSLKRVSIMASEHNGGVRFELKANELRITGDNPDLGEAQEDMSVTYAGEPLSISFNARYFIELVGEMTGDDVQLEFNGELDPGVVCSPKDGSYVGVVMPLHI